jgi:PAS domain S-box-containing protein
MRPVRSEPLLALWAELVLTISCLVAQTSLGIDGLSSVRAYGSGPSSKAQERPVFHLARDANGSDSQAYEVALRVVLADQTPHPNPKVEGFPGGGKRFERERHMDRVIALWAAADRPLGALQEIARKLHAEITSVGASSSLLRDPRLTDERLMGLEEESFGAGGRQQRGVLFAGLLAALLLAVGLTLLARLLGQLRKSQREYRQLIVALKESEERYRQLFEASPFPSWVFDSETLAFRTVNDAAIAQYGYSREEFLRMTLEDIRPEEDVPRLGSRLLEIQDRGGATPWRHRKKDGTLIDVEVVSHPVFFDTRPGRLVLVVNITERKRAEEALRLRDRAIEALSEGLVIADALAPDNPIIYANKAVEEITLYPTQEILGRNCRFLQGPGSNPRTIAEIREAVVAGKPVSVEILNYRRNGEPFWNQLVITPIRDEAGRLTHFVGLQTDISERKTAEDDRARLESAIRKSALEWRRTFDAIESPAMILDVQGRFNRLNRATRELLGRSFEDLIGQKVTEMAPGEPWRTVAGLTRRLHETRNAATVEVRDEITGRSWEVAGSLAAASEGDEEKLVFVARETTRMAELQESLRRRELMAAMGAIVAGVAHEVRNPLFGISANLDAFEARFGQQAEYQDFVRILRGEVDRLTHLMQELLDYGKPSTATLIEGTVPEVILQALRACGPLSESRGIRLKTTIPEDLGLVVMDRRRLVQVFQNIIENAIHHSPERGEVAITVEKGDGLRNGRRWIHCTVSDSGPGFRPEDLSRVFEPFFTRRRGGTGLGLSIVQRIVEEHGGEIEAVNGPRGGALLLLRLPILEPAPEGFGS